MEGETKIHGWEGFLMNDHKSIEEKRFYYMKALRFQHKKDISKLKASDKTWRISLHHVYCRKELIPHGDFI